MARVLFLMMPEPGHLIPTLPVAARLRKRGHEIAYVTVPQFRGLLTEMGFECISVATRQPEPETSDIWSVQQTGVTITGDLEAAFHAPAFRERLVQRLTQARPDLLVCDVVLTRTIGALLAHLLGRPMVSLSTWLPETADSDLPEIVLCPVEFDLPDVRRRSTNRHYCEPSVWRDRRPPPVAERLLRTGRPLVYCTLGTQSLNYPEAATVVRAVVAAFTRLPGHRLILAAGSLYEQLVKDALPPNVLVVRSAPQLQILRHADVVITHGGLGTLKEAIMRRVPAVVIPFRFDQPANGRRVEYHGIGRTCPPPACCAEWIRQAVLDISHDCTLRSRLSALSTVFWTRERESSASRLLQGLLPTCH